MDRIVRGDLSSTHGRALAWVDSLFVDHALIRLAWSNFAPVVPGRLYRSNHPTPGRLAAVARRYGIHTLVNLRGRTANGSDALSREMAGRLGVDFVDAPLKSSAAPPRERVLHLLDVFARMREPALVHCKSGADRAGLASAIFLLANGASVAEARLQLTLRFGHIAGAEAGVLGAFLGAYAREGEGRVAFRDWAANEYDPTALGVPRSNNVARFINTRLLRRE